MRKPGIDYKIKLKKINKRDTEVLWGPLYNIFKEELLILKKKLIRLLDKGFIKINKSAVKTLILFIYKLDKKFQFCVNYKTLNKIR